MIPIKSKLELQIMRQNGALLASILEKLKLLVKPGVSTYELDEFAEKLILEAGAIPAFKGYRGYEATLCTSINCEVVHGIPSKKRKLKNGDVISIDIGLKKDGLYADMAVTIPVGSVSDEIMRFLAVAEQALNEAIKKAVPGNRVGDISNAIQTYVESHGYNVVRDYVGHGVGFALHEEPAVPNFGKPNTGHKLMPGMVLAIEPMVNMGTHEVKLQDDGWTVVTADGSLSAHFEHSVAITESGPQILTSLPNSKINLQM